MSTVLVTGVAGLVGSAAAEAFSEAGYEIIGIDNNMRSKLFGTPEKHVGHEIDIRDAAAVEALFTTHSFDAIIHAAAQPSHDWAQREPLTDFDINARGTLILLEAARKHCPETVFVHVSTDKVYGENMSAEALSEWPSPYNMVMTETETRYEIIRSSTAPFYGFKEDLELDFAGQRSLFGCSKTAADIYVQEYGNYFGMKTVCFRPGCITGKNHEGAEYHGFLAYLAKCIQQGIPYKIFGNGKNVRDQIHARDLAHAFLEFVKKPTVAAVYNMGGGPERSVSVLEAIHLIEHETGKTCDYSFHEPRKGDRLWDVHDVSKFKADYPHWKYTYSLQDIIKELCS